MIITVLFVFLLLCHVTPRRHSYGAVNSIRQGESHQPFAAPAARHTRKTSQKPLLARGVFKCILGSMFVLHVRWQPFATATAATTTTQTMYHSSAVLRGPLGSLRASFGTLGASLAPLWGTLGDTFGHLLASFSAGFKSILAGFKSILVLWAVRGALRKPISQQMLLVTAVG